MKIQPIRNLVVVIDSMLAVIPAEQTQLIARLYSIKSSADLTTTPDVLRVLWNNTCHLLREYITFPPQKDWEYKVTALFDNEPEDKIRKDVKEHIEIIGGVYAVIAKRNQCRCRCC